MNNGAKHLKGIGRHRLALSGLRRAHHASFAALDAFYRFFLLYSPSLSFGEIVIVPAQNGLDIFLKIFAKLADLFFYVFSGFSLRAQQ